DLVHSDVCGPMKTKTLGGCSYFVTFNNDHSRKVWVYTLKTKDQVLDVFKQFHAMKTKTLGGCSYFVTFIDDHSRKNKPCVFLGYGQDELGYRLYDPIQKRLVRSRDVEFEEDQTLKNVEKAEKEIIPQHNDDPIDLDPVPPKHFDSQFEDDI
nr:putative ribonuclease H-like domain-containing protein [Tanacetum cinerariifolium]